tara:strand:- start:1069 stop:1245 length:177 start_codon:yes stop_codon:yes gene_type:complete
LFGDGIPQHISSFFVLFLSFVFGKKEMFLNVEGERKRERERRKERKAGVFHPRIKKLL